MKKSLIIFVVLSLLFSSCYKKLYQQCQQQTPILQQEYDKLGIHTKLVLSQKQEFQAINDSLRIFYDVLRRVNDSIKNEQANLEKMEEEELKKTLHFIIPYFREVANLALNEPPPCVNAANGHFRNNMTSRHMQSLSNPQIVLSTKSAIQLMTIFRTFSRLNQAAFVDNRNYAPPSWNVFRDWVIDHAKLIGNVILAIWNLIAGNDTTAAKAAVNAADEYKRKLKDEKCRKGYHANGWISAGVLDAAHNGLHIKHSYDYDGTSHKLQKIVAVLENSFSQLTTLQTKGHEPWLNGEWQLKYYAIMSATAWALDHLKHQD